MATFNGGPDNDTLVGTTSADNIFGFSGSDYIESRDGNDSLDGGDGDDILYAGSGNDTLQGATGDDGLAGDLGDDIINGGANFDLAFYDAAPSGVTVSLTTGRSSGGDGNDTLTGIEGLIGSNHNDSLTGDGNGNDLYGGAGLDTLTGMDGNDYLQGDNGDDLLFGGNDNDVLAGGNGNDFLDGGAGVDTGGYALNQLRSAYAVQVYGTGLTVERAGEGRDTLSGVEVLSFQDGDFVITTTGAGLLAAQVVGTLFGTAGLANPALVGYYFELFQWGLTLEEVANIAVASDEFAAAAGSHSDIDFVNTMYKNVAGVLPSAPVQAELVGYLQAGYTQGYIASVAADIFGMRSTDLKFEAALASVKVGLETADTITGDAGEQQIFGRGGNDTLSGLGGSDTIDGGSGIDRAVYTKSRAEYAVTHNDVGLVVDDLANTDLDKLISIERVSYTDTNVAYDIASGNAGTAAKIIGALFGVTALQEKALVGQYIAMLDSGMSEEAVVGMAAASDRFGAEAGGHSNQQFAERIYFNIAGFAGTPDAIAPIVQILDSGNSQAVIGTLAAELDYNIAHINLAGLAQTGLQYDLI
ncbi:MAG: calcium-binding protein [Pseudomonadota bacterium]